MALYLSLMLGAPIPPFDIGKIALSHAICPLRPLQMKERMLFSITVRAVREIPFTVIR